MASHKAFATLAIAAFVAVSGPAAHAQETTSGLDITIDPASLIERVGHSGVMQMPETMVTPFDGAQAERLVYEPYQMTDDLLERDDIVLLMRHGPTDWSRRDVVGVGATDCANQRVMTELGQQQMTALGAFMVLASIQPSEIVVSQWCRNQQTLASLLAGMDFLTPGYADEVPIEVDDQVNLLLSLNGAPNVTALRERILSWDGAGEGDGPLLIVTHFTNIQELTEFSVYEGEMLVLDPTLDGRVLGYVRLASSRPDIGHFDESVVPEQ